MIFTKLTIFFTKLTRPISDWMTNKQPISVSQRHPQYPVGSSMYGLLVFTDAVQRQ
jgi:hypothetical protein